MYDAESIAASPESTIIAAGAVSSDRQQLRQQQRQTDYAGGVRLTSPFHAYQLQGKGGALPMPETSAEYKPPKGLKVPQEWDIADQRPVTNAEQAEAYAAEVVTRLINGESVSSLKIRRVREDFQEPFDQKAGELLAAYWHGNVDRREKAKARKKQLKAHKEHKKKHPDAKKPREAAHGGLVDKERGHGDVVEEFWVRAAHALGEEFVTQATGTTVLAEEGEGFVRRSKGDYNQSELRFADPRLVKVLEQATADTVNRVRATGRASADPRVDVRDLNSAVHRYDVYGHGTHNHGNSGDIGYYYRDPATGELYNQQKGLKDDDFRPYRDRKDGKHFLDKEHPHWDLEANAILVEELLAHPEVKKVLVDGLLEEQLEDHIIANLDPEGLMDPKVRADLEQRIRDGIVDVKNHSNHIHVELHKR